MLVKECKTCAIQNGRLLWQVKAMPAISELLEPLTKVGPEQVAVLEHLRAVEEIAGVPQRGAVCKGKGKGTVRSQEDKGRG